VINLTPNKKRVFEEAFRVLKSGGRVMISDVVLTKELSEAVKKGAHPESCVQGAVMKDKYLEAIRNAGFKDVEITEERQDASFEDIVNDPNAKVIVRDKKKNTEELRRIFELDDARKEIVK
jgi:ubiquinone/menaquinone biosynthesis C-methylase UbiE